MPVHQIPLCILGYHHGACSPTANSWGSRFSPTSCLDQDQLWTWQKVKLAHSLFDQFPNICHGHKDDHQFYKKRNHLPKHPFFPGNFLSIILLWCPLPHSNDTGSQWCWCQCGGNQNSSIFHVPYLYHPWFFWFSWMEQSSPQWSLPLLS